MNVHRKQVVQKINNNKNETKLIYTNILFYLQCNEKNMAGAVKWKISKYNEMIFWRPIN